MRALRSPSRALPFLPQVCAAAGASLFVACSSSDDDDPVVPDTTAPAASTFVQDRGIDSTGQTVAVTFSEAVTAVTAEVAGSYTISGGVNVTSAVLRAGDTVVDLTLDALAIPGTNTITIAAGIEDAAGNASDAVTAAAITSTDTVAPAASSIVGTTIEGPENDTITVVFSDDMIEAEVETIANWSFESPLGNAFDATGATVDYVVATRTATVTLDAGSADQNLQTRDDIHANFTTMRDVAGNLITATAFGTTAVNAVISGDDAPPTILSAAPGGGNTAVLTFSEAITGVETLDLQTGPNPTGTEITITDVSDPGNVATGTIALTGTPQDGDDITISDGTTSQTFEFDFAEGAFSLGGDPNDTDSVAISDGTTSQIFEFDSNASITGDVTVTIAPADVPTTIANLITAINANGFNVTASAGLTTSDIVLTNDGTGAAGNTTISLVNASGNLSKTDFAGGGITGDIAVAVNQGSDAGTITNLRSGIDANGFNVTTANGGAGTDFVVNNDNAGTAGNVLITETDAGNVITIAGMAGGTAAGIATFEPTVSTASGTPNQATVTYTITPAALDTFRIYGVTDLAGNQMAPETAFAAVAADATQPSLSTGNSTVTAAAGEANDSIEVVFDRSVSPSGLTDPANYTLADGVGAIDISGATGTQTGADRVLFELGSAANIQSAQTYTITANNISNLQGAMRTSADTEAGIASGGDSSAPTVGAGDAQLDANNANSVLVYFDEPVDAAGAVIGNYTITGNTTTAVAMVTARVARVTFQNAPALAENVDVAAAAQTDLAGNTAVGVATVAITAADAIAPTVLTVAGNSSAGAQHTITVSYSEAVDMTAAVDPANYTVGIQGGAAISIADATFSTDSANDEVTITLPWGTYLDNGETLSVTTANVTDAAGNVIVAAPVTATIAGDAAGPASATGFINDKEDATGATVEVTFDEAMDTTATTTIGAWSGSNGQSATAVTAINRTTFRVTFDAPIGASDTIDITTPTDVANNAGGTITFNPAE